MYDVSGKKRKDYMNKRKRAIVVTAILIAVSSCLSGCSDKASTDGSSQNESSDIVSSNAGSSKETASDTGSEISSDDSGSEASRGNESEAVSSELTEEEQNALYKKQEELLKGILAEDIEFLKTKTSTGNEIELPVFKDGELKEDKKIQAWTSTRDGVIFTSQLLDDFTQEKGYEVLNKSVDDCLATFLKQGYTELTSSEISTNGFALFRVVSGYSTASKARFSKIFVIGQFEDTVGSLITIFAEADPDVTDSPTLKTFDAACQTVGIVTEETQKKIDAIS